MKTGVPDLWGNPIITPEPVANSTKRKPTQPKGYAAPPGSGPKGETCRGCEHYCRTGGHAKVYLKCALVKAKWTGGPGTDIKAKSPACAYWEKAKP